jgi:hypothetical protein
MVLQDKDRLGMLALGVQNDTPGTSLQPALPNGIHLRWQFGSADEFPRGGFYVLRRVSNEGTQSFCISQMLTRTLLGTLVGTLDDATLPVLSLFRSLAAGFAEFSSDRFIRLLDVEAPDETFELDFSNRGFLAVSHTAARRVDFKVALGSPPSGSGGTGTVGGGGAGAGTSFVTYVLTFPLPPGTQVTQFAAVASDRLDPRDRSKSDSPIANMGTQPLSTGTDCVFPALYSRSSITLNDRTHINGLVKTGGTLTRRNNVVVTGPVTEHAAFDPPVTFRREVVFPPGPGTDVLLEPDQQATIPPGRYGLVRVKSRAKLFLSTGAYFIDTLEVLEPQAQLVLDELNGSVQMYVLQPFAFRGAIVSNKPIPELLIGVINGGALRLESPFTGTIIAPKADLVIGSVPGNIQSGAFFAKTIEIQPDVQLVRHPSPGLTATPPIPITPGSCKISAWAGEHQLEERSLSGAGIVTGTFRFDNIDRVEIRQSQGGGRLVDLCVWSNSVGVNTGWQALTGFSYPLALPVRHPSYPASGGQATDLALSQGVALARIQYGPSSAFSGTPFQDLHDGFLVPLVAAGAGNMRTVVTTPTGQADPPDGQPAPHLNALSSLEIVVLGSLNPAVAQMLGLYFRDATAAANTFYDYMVVSDVANQFGGNINNLLSFLQTNPSLPTVVPHFWINYRVSLASTTALAAPGNLSGYIMPGAELERPNGAIVNSAAVAGFLWDLPQGTSTNLLSKGPVAYHFWRAAAGATAPPNPIAASAHAVITPEPQVISLDLLAAIPTPSAPEWPPFPLQYLDTGLSEGWYSYRVNGIDIFGRHSVLSSPAVWKQWRPPPDPAPWYFNPALSNDVVHPHALGALDKLAPPIPPGVEAMALDPNDPLVVKDARYNAWRATLSPQEQANLVGLRVRWNWSYSQIRQAPDTVEFRIYHQPGSLNNPSGRITAVSTASGDQSQVTTDITGSFAGDVLIDGTLRVGRAAYRITGNSAGSPLVLTVANLRLDSPAQPPANVGCIVSIPRTSPIYVDYQRAPKWAQRIHVVAYANVTEEAVVGAPAAGGELISGSGATASGTTVTVPSSTSLSAVQANKFHVLLASDTARPNKTYLITGVVAASHQLVLDGTPTLTGGNSGFDIGVYVRRYDIFLPAQGSSIREGARLTTSQAQPLVYANVGVTAADGRAHVNDDPGRNGTPFGNRPGNESAVGGPALIHRVHRSPPDAPQVPPDDEVVFATRANYRAESFYTFRWVPATGLRTVVLRALDDSLFQIDFLIRRTRAALSPTDPSHAPFFPGDWTVARRQAAAAALNAITSLASYPGLSADARALLARLPGNEARVFGAGLEQYDFAIRHTRSALSQADSAYFPPDWTDAARRTAAANQLNALTTLGAYATLSNNAQRILAGLPGNERAFTQTSVDPLDPNDPANANRVGPDNPESFNVNPSLRAYLATLDGRSRNRYFFRAQYVDQVQNRGALSLSSPPVTLPHVVPPRAPILTRVLAGDADAALPGDRKITLRWTSNRESDLSEYRVYRSSDPGGARDIRLMELAATVSVAPAAPRPAEVVFVDEDLRGGVTYSYRVVAEDESGNVSEPSRVLDARAFDTRPPVPPTLSVHWVDVGGVKRAEISWTSEFEVGIQRRGPESVWTDLAQFRPPGSVTIRDPFSEPAVGHKYRALVRSPVGAVTQGPAVTLAPIGP